MQAPPSLSEFLASSYQQYKEDTNTVASWLATTARTCGYPKDLLLNRKSVDPDKLGTQTSARLKGKARKVAKQAASSAGATASSTTRKPAYIIAIKDFINLAEFIAGKKKSSDKAPLYFAKSLHRAIIARKKHGTAAAARASSEDSKNSHFFFVGVLERVSEILAPIMPPGMTTEEHSRADCPVNDFSNRFATLHVEEPTQEFLNIPDVAIPERPPPDFEAEHFDDVLEISMAYCFLQDDVLIIRQVINNLWVGYKQGYYDLIPVSLVTNTAIDFVRALERELPASTEKYGGAPAQFEALSMGHHIDYGVDKSDSLDSKYDKHPWFYDMQEEVMMNAYLFLKNFWEEAIANPDKIPSVPSELRGSLYDPTSDRDSKTPSGRYAEDRILLVEFFYFMTLHCRTAFPDESSPEDELIRGFRICLNTGTIQLWNIFAVQLFLDIHHILREDAIRPFNEMREAAEENETTMKEIAEFYRNLGVKPWPAEIDKTFDSIMEMVELTTRKDVYQELQQRNPLWKDWEPFYFFRKDPVYCGLWKYKHQAPFHEFSISFASNWIASLSVSHLYHAVRHENLLPKAWKDMETFIDLQGEAVLGDRPPETQDEYARRFLIAHGVHASSFAKDARRFIQNSKTGIKPLALQAPLTRVFIDRFCRNSYRHDFTPDELQNIMEKTNLWSHEDVEVKDIRPWEVAFGLKLSRPSRSQARLRAKDMNRTKSSQRRGTIATLLKKMCHALQGEMVELTFNYFRMHMQCWKVLESIMKESRKVLPTMDCFPMIDKPYQLPNVAAMVFLSTMRTSNLFIAKVAQTNKASSTAPILFVHSANAIEAFIDKGEGAIVTGDLVEEEEDAGDDSDVKGAAQLSLNPHPIWRSQYDLYYAGLRAQHIARLPLAKRLAMAGLPPSTLDSEFLAKLIDAVEKSRR